MARPHAYLLSRRFIRALLWVAALCFIASPGPMLPGGVPGLEDRCHSGLWRLADGGVRRQTIGVVAG